MHLSWKFGVWKARFLKFQNRYQNQGREKAKIAGKSIGMSDEVKLRRTPQNEVPSLLQ